MTSNENKDDEISITKTLSSLKEEEKDLTKEKEVLMMKIKNTKISYSKFLKMFNEQSKSVIDLEKSYETIQLKLSSLKKKQKLIIGAITKEYFSYFTPMCSRIDPAIYEGFLLFVGYDQEKKEQVDISIATKENLISLLDNSLHYLSLLSEIDYKEYKEKKRKIVEEKKNEIQFPFDILYDYFTATFDIIDKEKESEIVLNKIENINMEKNLKFINLKALEIDILKKETQLKNYEKYLLNVHTLLDKYKKISQQSPSLLKNLTKSVTDLKKVNSHGTIEKITPNKKTSSSPRKETNSFKTIQNKTKMSTAPSSSKLNKTYSKNNNSLSLSNQKSKQPITTKKALSTFVSKHSTPIHTYTPGSNILDTIENFKLPSRANTRQKHNYIKPILDKKDKPISLISAISWNQSRIKKITKENKSNKNHNEIVKSNSKESIDCIDINSVCDEIGESPMFMTNHKCNTSSCIISSNSNNNISYNSNSYMMFRQETKAKRNMSQSMNFKIEKPIAMGGCCVSCT